MEFDPNKHHRRSIRLKGYDYTQPGAYFITVVSYQRQYIFGEIVDGEMHLNWVGRLVQREWQRLTHRFPNIELDEFVIMPNHLHGIILIIKGTTETEEDNAIEISRCAHTCEQFGKPVPGSIPTIIRSFKSAVSLRINRSRESSSTPVWQRNYFERVVRDQSELKQIREYIQYNPAQWSDDPENIIG
jgi:putative transposase